MLLLRRCRELCPFGLQGLVLIATAAGLDAQSCSVEVLPGSVFVDRGPQRVSLKITAKVTSCAWSISSEVPWVKSGNAPQQGPGAIELAIGENTSSHERRAELHVGDRSVSVLQRATRKTFEDVNPSDAFFDAANLLRQRSITAGCTANPLRFCPQDAITRSQLAIFLVRLILGTDAFAVPATPYFSDIPVNYPYFRWIQKSAEVGVRVPSAAEGKFCPDCVVTRGEMAAFLVQARLLGGNFEYVKEPFYSDVPANHPLFRFIQKMKSLDIPGCSATAFCPATPVSRGEMAVFLASGKFDPPNAAPAGRTQSKSR